MVSPCRHASRQGASYNASRDFSLMQQQGSHLRAPPRVNIYKPLQREACSTPGWLTL